MKAAGADKEQLVSTIIAALQHKTRDAYTNIVSVVFSSFSFCDKKARELKLSIYEVREARIRLAQEWRLARIARWVGRSIGVIANIKRLKDKYGIWCFGRHPRPRQLSFSGKLQPLLTPSPKRRPPPFLSLFYLDFIIFGI